MNHNTQLIEELEHHLKTHLLPSDTKQIISNVIQAFNEQETELHRLRLYVGDDILKCFICRLKQHYKEAYTEGFYKTLENGINKIIQDMESEQNANSN